MTMNLFLSFESSVGKSFAVIEKEMKFFYFLTYSEWPKALITSFPTTYESKTDFVAKWKYF